MGLGWRAKNSSTYIRDLPLLQPWATIEEVIRVDVPPLDSAWLAYIGALDSEILALGGSQNDRLPGTEPSFHQQRSTKSSAWLSHCTPTALGLTRILAGLSGLEISQLSPTTRWGTTPNAWKGGQKLTSPCVISYDLRTRPLNPPCSALCARDWWRRSRASRLPRSFTQLLSTTTSIFCRKKT